MRNPVTILSAAALILTALSCSPKSDGTSGTDSLFGIFDIAYSVQGDGCHFNSIEHFKAAAGAGFNCLKADMQMTSDGVIVLCHDNGFTFDKDGRIDKFNSKERTMIKDMTYGSIKDLEYNSGKAETGLHPKVCTLEQLAAFCKESGVWMYVTQRNNDQVDATQAELKRILEKYGMTDRCIVNNYPPVAATCRTIHKYLPSAPISFTLTPQMPLTKEIVDTVISVAPAVICINRKNIPDLDPELIEYSTSNGVPLHGWYPESIEEYDSWKAMGLTGAQICNETVVSR